MPEDRPGVGDYAETQRLRDIETRLDEVEAQPGVPGDQGEPGEPGAPGDPGPTGPQGPGFSPLWIPGFTSAEARDTVPGRFGVASVISLASGKPFRFALPYVLKAGVAYSKIGFLPSSAGSGHTHFWMGIARASDGVLLRATADDTSPTFVGSAMKVMNLASAYTPVADERVDLVICYNGSGSPDVKGISVAGLSATEKFLAGYSDTTRTGPPADGTALSFGNTLNSVGYMAVGT